MKQLRRAVWFLRHSWGFLGCDSGTGRHRARVRYFTGLPYALPAFLWASRNDDWEEELGAS